MKRLSFLLMLVLLVAALPVLAQDDMGFPDFIQHSECSEDLTGQNIEILHFGDLSGSYAFITQPLLAGLGDAIAYYNDHGGVCGATLSQRFEDTAGDPDQVLAAYDRFSTEDPKPQVLVLYASGDAEALRDRVAEDEIPVLISAGSVPGLYGEDGQTPGWIFATNPLYTDQLGSFCQFVGQDPMDMFPENPTLGYISWEGAFGRAADTAETRAYCAEQGVNWGGSEFFLPITTDISTQVQNLVDAGANILYTNSLATGPALVASTVVNLGLEDQVVLAGVNWALDTSVGLLGQGTFGADGLPSTNGLIGSAPFYWWTERSQPGIALINEVVEGVEAANPGTRPPQARNIAYLLGWQTVDLYTEIYIQTANRVGFANITGADIKETVEALDYSPLGLTDINFQEGRRSTSANRIAMMAYLGEDGATPASADNPPLVLTVGDRQILVPILVPLTDFVDAPDLRPGGADVPAS
ncbi:MAG: ABC transporter substrate-binding protein [Chloroflexi bacterium]|nr:ABC transporter substrate-binding protein [Chloroflexota bacterium]